MTETYPSYLDELESESIYIIREAAASLPSMVMLYSMGKDSTVLAHLAIKAFWPQKPPFALLHIDTGWKFQAMLTFKEKIICEHDFELITYINKTASTNPVTPFSHSASVYTDIMKTQALRQALSESGFDAALGGARRDEEKSRAKERIFSLRNRHHRWDAKNQRPELWQIYNIRKKQDESWRIFPLSNWSEIDVWLYIKKEKLDIVPLYLAKKRPVVERNGNLIMLDDARMKLNQNEKIQNRMVRFRSLGCYPLTAAFESNADSIDDIITELIDSKKSERQGRIIDKDAEMSMEQKKQQGYF